MFQLAKRAEMKELLGGYADGQIAQYEKSIAGESGSLRSLCILLDSDSNLVDIMWRMD